MAATIAAARRGTGRDHRRGAAGEPAAVSLQREPSSRIERRAARSGSPAALRRRSSAEATTSGRGAG
ncbi:hypothetical protein [Streptosporangium sp. CA-115845]|uniref:hypothetical protein n=1 Tax=Streptosporangium sp. CA-115845 TaxID=3240071 RepID=UPI003D8DED98